MEGSHQRSEPHQKPPRPFDFDKYPTRFVCLRLAYHGQTHDGLAKQVHTANTVEAIVCEALKRLKLIPNEGPQRFSRCARTDKGVSALGNAFSLVMRAAEEGRPDFDYCKMINGCLPPTIRIVAWSFVPDTFDARFSCTSRTYRYYFCAGALDLSAMQEAAQFLVGEHNFRNFCRLDVCNVDNFLRRVLHVAIAALDGGLAYLEITATAFLYHQIRCTMHVLFLVGQKLEPPSVVKSLLERGDAKPQYPLADDAPLVLWECAFDPRAVQWRYSSQAMTIICAELHDIHAAMLIRAVISREMSSQLLTWCGDWTCAETSSVPRATAGGDERKRSREAVTVGSDWTAPRRHAQLKARHQEIHCGMHRQDYIPLLERETEMTYAEKVSNLQGSKKTRHEENLSKKREDSVE